MIAKVAYSMSLIDIQIYLFNALGTNIALSHPQTHSTSYYINYQILQNTSLFLRKALYQVLPCESISHIIEAFPSYFAGSLTTTFL